MRKCAICDFQWNESEIKCPSCGYLNRTLYFFNQDEFDAWWRSVIVPQRESYRAEQVRKEAEARAERERKEREEKERRAELVRQEVLRKEAERQERERQEQEHKAEEQHKQRKQWLMKSPNHFGASGVDFKIWIKEDGTVQWSGAWNHSFEQELPKWKNIVAIAAGYQHILGLKADGTVVAVGRNTAGQCDVQTWKDIVEIEAYEDTSVAVDRNGKIFACGAYAGRVKELIWAGIKVDEQSVGKRYIQLGKRGVWWLDGRGKAFNGSYQHDYVQRFNIDEQTELFGSGVLLGSSLEAKIFFDEDEEEVYDSVVTRREEWKNIRVLHRDWDSSFAMSHEKLYWYKRFWHGEKKTGYWTDRELSAQRLLGQQGELLNMVVCQEGKEILLCADCGGKIKYFCCKMDVGRTKEL